MDLCSHALAWLAPRASLGRPPAHFAAAYLDGQCPLCHSPIQEALDDLPCPHWLIRSRSDGHVDQPFARYGVEGVLTFLLLCVDAERSRAGARQYMWFSEEGAQLTLHVRLKRRVWRFVLAPQAGTLRMEYQNLRTRSAFSYDVAARTGDAAVLGALVAWSAGGRADARLR